MTTEVSKQLQSFLIIVFILLAGQSALAQNPETNVQSLLDLEVQLREKLAGNRGELYQRLMADPAGTIYNNDEFQLMYIKDGHFPRFYGIENLTAAQTISTDEVWPGGSAGLSLSGSGTTSGQLAVWDAGAVLSTHQEFGSRVTQIDSPGGTHYHSTHVAGTMIASGFDSDAVGMSYNANLVAYDWSDDEAEMASAAAAGLNVSNHSYGYVAGWRNYSGDWYWFGDVEVSETEDYGFGFYGDDTVLIDQIAYDAPYYTIVKSAGNDRNDYGPGPGGEHYYWDADTDDWELSTDDRSPDGGADGYDSVPWKGSAKNIITVGAIDDIPGGYTDSGDVAMSSFSGWGPVDDGRIKPDLVANGVGLYSAMDSGDNDYASLSGTSMSAPNLAGSLNLLVRHYETVHGGTTPLASTMKAVLVHTADEAGSAPGPDYSFGWGLMNTQSAAEIISADGSDSGYIREETLGNGDSDEYDFYSDGTNPIRVTVSWTDPPGAALSPELNPTTLALVNDLDLKIEKIGGNVYSPYVLDPLNPATAATTGDNVRDNTEMVYLASPAAGLYRITVSHKGSLGSGQTYSLVQSSIEQSAGACCHNDGSCAYVVEVDCQDGDWLANEVCDPNPCVQPSGACCDPMGVCNVTLEDDCNHDWTMFEVCDPNPCVQPLRACCAADGTCTLTEMVSCQGDWLAGEPACDPNPCEQPTGSCCHPYGTCTVTYIEDCEWNWSINEVCDPNPCAQPQRACCFEDESCEVLEETDCISSQGAWQSNTTNCDPNPCPLLAVGDLWLEDDGLLSSRTPGLFKITTDIFYNVIQDGPVTLTVHDLTGRVVRQLLNNDVKQAGRHHITWNGGDDNGHELISGVYYYRIQASGKAETRSVIRMK